MNDPPTLKLNSTPLTEEQAERQREACQDLLDKACQHYQWAKQRLDEACQARTEASEHYAKSKKHLDKASKLLEQPSPRSILFMVVGLVAFVCAAFLRWA